MFVCECLCSYMCVCAHMCAHVCMCVNYIKHWLHTTREPAVVVKQPAFAMSSSYSLNSCWLKLNNCCLHLLQPAGLAVTTNAAASTSTTAISRNCAAVVFSFSSYWLQLEQLLVAAATAS